MKEIRQKVKSEGGLTDLFLELLQKMAEEYGSQKIPTALARHYICSRLNITKRKFREIMRKVAEEHGVLYTPKFIGIRGDINELW